MKPPRYILACSWLLLFPCAKGLLAQDVGILGPNGLTSEGIFRRAGIPSATVMFGAELNKYKVLVVTPNALRDNGGPFIKYGEQIRQFVKDGGFLFVLHQNDRGWQDKWLPYRTGNSNGANPLVKIVAKEHALFEGISESDLGAGNKGVILFDTFVDVAPEWKVLATNIDPDGKKKERIAAIECTLGKGRVLINCFDPYVDLDALTAKDIKKLRLMLNGLRYALASRGIAKVPDMRAFVAKQKDNSVLPPSVRLTSSKFHIYVRRFCRDAGVELQPTGLMSNVHYHGAIFEKTKHLGKYDRQHNHFGQNGFIIHWKQGGEKKLAGMHPGDGGQKPGGKRMYADIEIPVTSIDSQSAYTSFISADRDARIEAVTSIVPDGKFILKEIYVTNIGKSVMEQTECHFYVSMLYLSPVKGYRGPLTYIKDEDMLLAAPTKEKAELPNVTETCALTGTTRSRAHSIEPVGGWGTLELLTSSKDGRLNGRITTGISNNADKGGIAGIMVWPLGRLAPGESGFAVAILAVGDNEVDLKKEIDAAKAYYEQNKPLRAKADRKSYREKYALLNWRDRTHSEYREFINRDDPDGDGWNLAREKKAGTDPLREDTDRDNLSDFIDPDPLTPEPLLVPPTREEIEKDKVIGLSQREIIRCVRGQNVWSEASSLVNPHDATRYFAMLRNLHVNCVSIRIGDPHTGKVGVDFGEGNTFGYRSKHHSGRDLLAQFIAVCHRYDIGVRLEGLLGKAVGGNAALEEWVDRPGGKKARIPGWSCFNGWVRGAIAAMIFDVAKYPAEFMSLDEERAFYSYGERNNTGICLCPVCVHRFKHEMGYDIPGLKEAGEGRANLNFYTQMKGRKAFELQRWRKKCSTEAWRYWNHVATTRNPRIKFMQQSVETGGPYMRGGEGQNFTTPGLSGVDIGYKSGMGYGSDHLYYPYWFTHRKNTNHFVWSGMMKAAIAQVPSRRGWIELGGDFRRFWEPIWCYGQFMTSVAHGGKGVEYFMLSSVPGPRINDSGVFEKTDGPKWGQKITGVDKFEYLKMAYRTIDELNDWLYPAQPAKQIALLWDAVSDEVCAVLEEPNKYAISDPGKTQAHFMSYLFRTGYPFDMYYLHYTDYEALKDYPVIVLPSPLCVARDRAPILERLVKNGASLVILGEYGQFDYDGKLHERPMLLDLAGIKEITSPRLSIGNLTTQDILKNIDPGDVTFRVYENVVPSPGTHALAKMKGEDKGIYLRKLGKGQVVFMPGSFAASCLYPYQLASAYSTPTRAYDITRPGTTLMNAVLDHCLGEKKAIIRYERIAPDANADTEIALLETGPKEKTLFIFNWEADRKSILELGLKMPTDNYKITEWSMKPSDKTRIDEMEKIPFKWNGKKIYRKADLESLKIELEPQQIRILHIAPSR